MEQLDQQLLTMLARKAQLNDELDQLNRAIGQITAIKQFVAAQPAPQPETPAEA